MVLSRDHSQSENAAVDSFLQKYNDRVTGVISCFDRMLFKGYLPIGWADAMEALLYRQGLLIKDFGKFVEQQSERLKEHAEQLAKSNGRPFEYINGALRKDEYAKQIADRDGITQGLICVLRILEPCQSFSMVPGEKRPKLVNATRKCLCYYFYFVDRDFGLMHVRIQSWFPLVIQICLNGHEWLARKLDKHGIEYRREGNAFLWISDCQVAQKFADRMENTNWPRVFSAIARRVNPLLKDVLAGMEYYWVMDQIEYATDVMFRDAESLKTPYEQLLKHATLCFSAEDILTFLGRKMHGRFEGEVLTDMKKKRFPGARVKHRMKENWMKMYDKHGCVLRIETVINNPREFKVRREGKRKGEIVTAWFPMSKGVSNMYRYREVAMGANRRYLEALAVVPDPGQWKKQIQTIGRPARTETRSHRALNPANKEDVDLLAVVMRGEFNLHGFRNADIRERLNEPPTDATQQRRQSHRTGRLLKLLHAHGLIAKIPRTRRWRVTKHGQSIMTAILTLHHEAYLNPNTNAA
jgi:hypothetical protein